MLHVQQAGHNSSQYFFQNRIHRQDRDTRPVRLQGQVVEHAPAIRNIINIPATTSSNNKGSDVTESAAVEEPRQTQIETNPILLGRDIVKYPSGPLLLSLVLCGTG